MLAYKLRLGKLQKSRLEGLPALVLKDNLVLNLVKTNTPSIEESQI
jgi:hypothetical protein